MTKALTTRISPNARSRHLPFLDQRLKVNNISFVDSVSFGCVFVAYDALL